MFLCRQIRQSGAPSLRLYRKTELSEKIYLICPKHLNLGGTTYTAGPFFFSISALNNFFVIFFCTFVNQSFSQIIAIYQLDFTINRLTARKLCCTWLESMASQQREEPSCRRWRCEQATSRSTWNLVQNWLALLKQGMTSRRRPENICMVMKVFMYVNI